MTHEVFISHASADRHTATAMCAALEARRIRCWIAQRDVTPGRPYAEEIVHAIADCRVAMVVMSAGANVSLHVRNEVEQAVTKGKLILPVRIEDITPTSSLEYHLGGTHWLDALPPPVERHLERVAESVARLLETSDATSVASSDPSFRGPPARSSPGSPSGFDYRSDWEFLGWPLVHISLGADPAYGRRHVARGIVAIGDVAHGVVAIGNFTVGVIAFGALSIGVLPVGFLSLGIFSVGAIAAGLIASYGALSAAPIAVGAAAFGYIGKGEVVFAQHAWDNTMMDQEAAEFFAPWLSPGINALLVALCFLAYFARHLAFAGARMLDKLRRN